MNLDANDLLMESYSLEGVELDIETPKPQRAITSLPNNFQIRTMSDIKTLEEFVAINYTKGIKLYRGHESHDYKIVSTIVRHVVEKEKKCSVEDILEAEKKNIICFVVMVSKQSGYLINQINQTRHCSLCQ